MGLEECAEEGRRQLPVKLAIEAALRMQGDRFGTSANIRFVAPLRSAKVLAHFTNRRDVSRNCACERSEKMKKTTRVLFGVTAVLACGFIIGLAVTLMVSTGCRQRVQRTQQRKTTNGAARKVLEKKWGVFDIDYSRTLSPDYEVRVFHHEGDVMFRVEYKNRPIGEMRVNTRHIEAVMTPYKVIDDDKPDNISVFCDGTSITTVRWLTEGDNTIMLLDRNNDGFPELRTTSSSTERVHEDIKPIFTLKEKKNKSVEEMELFEKK